MSHRAVSRGFFRVEERPSMPSGVFVYMMLLLIVLTSTFVNAELPPLIPRSVLLGNPERWGPKLSPDGRQVAWIAPDTNNVLQVWARNLVGDKERVITADRKRGVRQFFWAKNNRTLLYAQDSDGDENYHIFGVELRSGNVRDYTPFQGVRVDSVDSGDELSLNADFPESGLLSLNLRNRALFDVYRLNLANGGLELDTQNPGDVTGWTADAKMQIRLARATTPEGGTELRVRKDRRTAWRTFLKATPDEILEVIGFSRDGKAVYLKSSLGRDTAAVVQRELETGIEKVVASSEEVDAGEVLVHPRSRVVEAVAFSPERLTWRMAGPALASDFAALSRLNDGSISIVSRTERDDIWIVSFSSASNPLQYYEWDRKAKLGNFLFTTRPKLQGLALGEMKPIVVKARDGLKIHGYISFPAGVEPKGLPLIVFPHG